MFVFEMNDSDWVAAASLESAQEFYRDYARENYGDMPDEELMDDPKQLSEAEMERYDFNDDGEHRTFKEQLARLESERVKFPCFFGSTEW